MNRNRLDNIPSTAPSGDLNRESAPRVDLDPFGPAEDKEGGLLVSYHYFKTKDLAPILERLPVKPMVFSDSGGFSAHSQGAPVDIDQYISWLRRNKSSIDIYANLDVIGDWRGTLKNQIKMERAGLRPLPCLHYGSDPSEIRRYARHGYDYMCLGGLVPHSFHLTQALTALRKKRQPPKKGEHIVRWLDECHMIAAEEGMGLHGFGVTNWRAVTRYPWKSVDSSTWVSGSKFGTLILFDPDRGRWVKGGRRNSFNDMMRMSPLLRKYGLPVSRLACDTNFTSYTMSRATARSWLVAQRHLSTARTCDTKIFLAMINPEQISMVFNNAAKHAADGVDQWT